jgi:hypothetical protein
MAFFVIRALPASFEAVSLLVGMLAVTLLVACLRLALLVEYVKTSNQAVVGQSADSVIFLKNFSAITYFLSDFEVFFSIIISCIPGLRAWVRIWRENRSRTKPSENVMNSD